MSRRGGSPASPLTRANMPGGGGLKSDRRLLTGGGQGAGAAVRGFRERFVWGGGEGLARGGKGRELGGGGGSFFEVGGGGQRGSSHGCFSPGPAGNVLWLDASDARGPLGGIMEDWGEATAAETGALAGRAAAEN